MYYNQEIATILTELKTDTTKGLSDDEAVRRREEYGANRLEKAKKKSLAMVLFSQLNDPLIFVLLIAAAISAFMGEWNDAAIIAVVVILNAVIGTVQETKAEKSMEALKKLSVPHAYVMRSGEIKEIDAEEIVPGDIIHLDAGRYIPCDLRLVETANLQIEESALTGESVPVNKNISLIDGDDKIPLGDRRNMAYSSTLVTNGRGVGVAVATGMGTEIGKIAEMLKMPEEKTPLQKRLAGIGKLLGVLALIICAAMFGVGVFQKRDLFQMFMTAVSLAVAAIPEGMPAIVSIVLALGVSRMVKRNAIIRKLPSVETLGAVNVICSDKTGTLTQNKMTVMKFYVDGKVKKADELDMESESNRLLIENLLLCNDATMHKEGNTGDPTEIALLAAGQIYGLEKDAAAAVHPRISEVPFDSDRKLMTTVNRYGEKACIMTKGAADQLLKISNRIRIGDEILPLTPESRQAVQDAADEMSNQALRVLGAAYREIDGEVPDGEEMESNLVFLGLTAMIDPPRMEVKGSIETCKNAGVRTVMITGDHITTAFAIASELGIAKDREQAVEGVWLDQYSDRELSVHIKDKRVFARVSPEHKVRIVRALKADGNIVSMTGDGVNDAPSLKAADIGVAMGITGTDVAKGAADIVLTDDNFSTIVSAVEEGRNIYANIKKSILFLLSCNIGEIVALFLATIMGWATPLLSIHLLWVNLITDSFPALSLGVDPGDPDIMKEKPRDTREGLFHKRVSFLAVNGILIGLLTLAAFAAGVMTHTGDRGFAALNRNQISAEALMAGQTMSFVVLSISQLFHALNLRHEKKSIFQVGVFRNKYLTGSILLGILLQLAVLYFAPLARVFEVTVLSGQQWLIAGGLILVPLVFNELWKALRRL